MGGTEFCWGGLRMESWASRWAPKHPPTPLSRGPHFNIGAVLSSNIKKDVRVKPQESRNRADESLLGGQDAKEKKNDCFTLRLKIKKLKKNQEITI